MASLERCHSEVTNSLDARSSPGIKHTNDIIKLKNDRKNWRLKVTVQLEPEP